MTIIYLKTDGFDKRDYYKIVNYDCFCKSILFYNMMSFESVLYSDYLQMVPYFI